MGAAKLTSVVATLTSRNPVGFLIREAPKTAELIAANLRSGIVRGELRPGQVLPSEVQLMAHFGVSRPTLREAFRILESETLISVRRGARGGAQVQQPDPSVASRYLGLVLQMRGTTPRDVYEARMVIEPYCARLLGGRRTDNDLADLQTCVDHVENIARDDPAAMASAATWFDVTWRFHEVLLTRCGNETLAAGGRMLADIAATHLRQNHTAAEHADDTETVTVPSPYLIADGATQTRRTVRSMRKLVRLVEAGDADGAEDHWRGHMRAAGSEILRRDEVIDLFG